METLMSYSGRRVTKNHREPPTPRTTRNHRHRANTHKETSAKYRREMSNVSWLSHTDLPPPVVSAAWVSSSCKPPVSSWNPQTTAGCQTHAPRLLFSGRRILAQ
ncbi:hypothetical protein EYF80_059296 [Liparis tanakae]|uniref:Uncharacterized protein n=1 Tax=Liparis tanakae TaxID=230148 RepID=A0A4Z2EQK0_9TELE|nr:hypothetical protein EYF80_059296 [Liparis tanakae]